MMKRNMVLLAAATTAAGLCHSAFATPYAAQISESGGNVSFVLNEAADSVTIVRDGVADTTSITDFTAGAKSFARNGAANYQIIVNKASAAATAAGYLNIVANNYGITTSNTTIQGPVGAAFNIGDVTQRSQQYELPRDIAINTNPATPSLFGRAYVINPRQAASASGRTVTAGVYILNADRTALSPAPATASDVGLQGGAGTAGNASGFDGVSTDTTQLYKVSLDDVGNLYVADAQVTASSFSATGSPGVRVFNPDVTASADLLAGLDTVKGVDASTSTTTPPVVTPSQGDVTPTTTQNHGHVGAILVTGSAAAGNLVVRTVDQDIQPTNTVQVYNLGSTPNHYSGLPTAAASLIIPVRGVLPDIEVNNQTGNIYLSQGRSAGTETGLWVLSATDTKTVLYDSLKDTQLLGLDGNASTAAKEDVIRLVQGTAISRDGKWMAFAGSTNQGITAVPLIEGIPDLANRVILATAANSTGAPAGTHTDNFTGGTTTDVEFDAADNLFGVSRSNEQLREYTPAGISRTVYNSNGTFQVVNGNAYDGSGAISDSSKYLGGITSLSFGSVGATENMLTVGALSTGAQTLNIDAKTVLAKLNFSGGNYTVSGTGPLVFGGDDANESYLEGRIIAETGNQTINTQVDIRKNFGVAALTGATLTLTNTTYANAAISPGLISAGGLTSNVGNLTIQKFGGGQVNMPAFSQKLLLVRQGILKFNDTTATAAKVKSLVISGITGATSTVATSGTAAGSLDLGGNGIVVDYDAPTGTAVSPLADVNYLLASGRTSGKGIISSAAAANPRLAVVAAEATSLPKILTAATYLGVPIDNTSVIVRTLLKGDADFSGNVNFDDLVVLAQNYNQTGKTWTSGDFTFDGTVNFDDLVPLAQNYNASYSGTGALISPAASAAVFASDWAFAQSLVPEPTSLSLLGLGAAAMIRRRK